MTRGNGTSRRPTNRAEARRGQCRQLRIDSPPRTDATTEIELETENAQETPESLVPPAQPLGEGQSEQAQNSMCSRVRGVSHGCRAPNTADGRMLIKSCGNGFEPFDVTRKLVKIMRQYWEAWPTWRSVPHVSKEFLYGKFREHFKWLLEHEAEFRRSWEYRLAKNFRNNIHNFKKKAMKEGGQNPQNWVDYKPIHMATASWKFIIDEHFRKEKYEEKCQKARENRMTERDGSMSKHTCGSIPPEEHKQRMEKQREKENNHAPATELEVQERTHRTQQENGEFVDDKAKKARVNYDEKYSTKYGTAPSSESNFDISVWIEAVGDPSKNKSIYGIGSTHTCDNVRTPVSTNSVTSQVIDEVTLNTVIEERLANEREKAAARENGIREKARRMVEESKKNNEALKEVVMKILEKVPIPDAMMALNGVSN